MDLYVWQLFVLEHKIKCCEIMSYTCMCLVSPVLRPVAKTTIAKSELIAAFKTAFLIIEVQQYHFPNTPKVMTTLFIVKNFNNICYGML